MKLHQPALGVLLANPALAAVIYPDNFDDNTITGWTFFDRDGAEEITAVILDAEAGETSVTWTSEAGKDYFLDRSIDLVNWEEIEDTIGETGTTTRIDLSPPAGGKAFYRVRSE